MPNTVGISHQPHLRQEFDPFSERLCSSEYRTINEIKTPLIPTVKNYHTEIDGWGQFLPQKKIEDINQ
jgi:hypothetical protein